MKLQDAVLSIGPLRTPRKPKLHEIVVRDGSMRWGVVVDVRTIGSREIVIAHYIDDDGKLMRCPDTRCNNKWDTCPIHLFTADVLRCDIVSVNDVAFYANKGWLDDGLASKAISQYDPANEERPHAERNELARFLESLFRE